ncbi:tetratricopeptide repeat protein [Crenothrix sp.]|uniref:tetratricopeptide repeat protein n=1 Tax=Crenothrix sp. TaxID=3100433 RepID=UPI00374D720F
MKKTTFVALLLLTTHCFANDIKTSLASIESQWAIIYYKTPKVQQEKAYQQLLDQANSLALQFPKAAEPLFWQAVIKATYADQQDGLSALKAINEARDLLTQAITIDSKAMEGSAYVTLGTLYYMVPGWPIAFGDNNKARKMFQAALKINPNGIDANYFYGEFLASVNELKEAQKYFEIASKAPTRNEQNYADNKLKEEATMALKNINTRKISHVKKMFLSLLNSDKIN